MMNGILVEWNSVDAKGTQTWEASPLLAHARIESSQNRPTIVEWSLPKPTRERPQDLTSYTKVFAANAYLSADGCVSCSVRDLCALRDKSKPIDCSGSGLVVAFSAHGQQQRVSDRL